MPSPDFAYLRRIAGAPPVALLREPKFLQAQELFFSVVDSLGGSIDFDLADMREVHAVAALGDVSGLTVLDVGCGSVGPYVLEDTFRDRYPPFFAEMMARVGADVTGLDIRPNASVSYDHRVVDLTKNDWVSSVDTAYDIIACLNLFNAPASPFEHDEILCGRLMDDMRSLLDSDGLLIMTLRDDLFDSGNQEHSVREYVASKKFALVHVDGNCVWLKRS